MRMEVEQQFDAGSDGSNYSRGAKANDRLARERGKEDGGSHLKHLV